MGNIVNILHLSDLHFGIEASGKYSDTVIANRKNTLEELIVTLKKLEKEWLPNIIVISGDIGWKGDKQDYVGAKKWLNDELLTNLNLTQSELILCPGNHDINRDKTKGLGPPDSHEDADDWLAIEHLDNLIKPFQAYNSFCKDMMKVPELRIGDKSFNLMGQRVIEELRFVVLNSAWFCRGDHDKDKLWLGLPQIKVLKAQKQIADRDNYDEDMITISVFHHPPLWLNEYEQYAYVNRPATFDYLSEQCHVIFTGHVHASIKPPDRKGDCAYLLSGGATYKSNNYRNNFSIIQIDKTERGFSRLCYEFDPRNERWEKKVDDIFYPFNKVLKMGKLKKKTSIDKSEKNGSELLQPVDNPLHQKFRNNSFLRYVFVIGVLLISFFLCSKFFIQDRVLNGKILFEEEDNNSENPIRNAELDITINDYPLPSTTTDGKGRFFVHIPEHLELPLEVAIQAIYNNERIKTCLSKELIRNSNEMSDKEFIISESPSVGGIWECQIPVLNGQDEFADLDVTQDCNNINITGYTKTIGGVRNKDPLLTIDNYIFNGKDIFSQYNSNTVSFKNKDNSITIIIDEDNNMKITMGKNRFFISCNMQL
ncbi:MAG: metallophosphoesterase [Desulfobacterales bacterium]|nr:metallophosphoesterase [Desulfobacterales bacterium]